mmetsp:Transcript_37980/g.88731  ORF Transcript_37980/g.88731 Transcript_37980/m.88731 type:complete len:221 (-) Transcript_37980:84-746(-)|eukprot:CAMPEP_0178414620 /NCGR_PEP_ID=MMETSP0689_2-20121128/23129_1 /TAXON_ID=160604 /ORGANISM="Amphidinium massartii, Strain CS-259" /LENGTH=220 /DNA_ID=CAMNT_0020035913 /DNA_START=60 /DNA_END=722 /DNA_ORIENTATION=-
MARITAAAAAVAVCLALAGLQTAFLASGVAQRQPASERSAAHVALQQEASSSAADSGIFASAAPLLAGVCMGLAVFVAAPTPAVAGSVEEVPIVMDAKGSTTTLTKEQLGRGKRLFNAACSTCHVGGGTRTNQNVGLDLESLQGARPRRDNVEGLVDYLNSPTTYDGLVDISEVHPSMKAAKVWPKMRFMKQQDLVDISSYIMYETQVITEKWGGGKIYY